MGPGKGGNAAPSPGGDEPAGGLDVSGALKREEQAAIQTGHLDLGPRLPERDQGIGPGPADAAAIPPTLNQWRTTWHTRHRKLLDEQAVNREKARGCFQFVVNGRFYGLRDPWPLRRSEG